MDFRDLKIMPVQVERMHVVALVYESESITATLMYLDRLALIVRLSVDYPDVESKPPPPLVNGSRVLELGHYSR
jgi:hypothetical protein